VFIGSSYTTSTQTTSGTISLTALASGDFIPASFEIGGNTYQLGCGVNNPPEIAVDSAAIAVNEGDLAVTRGSSSLRL